MKEKDTKRRNKGLTIHCVITHFSSKIDFRYSARDLCETFHKCWAHKRKLNNFFLPFRTLAFKSFLQIKAQNGSLARTIFFSLYFKIEDWGLFYLKENCVPLRMRGMNFFIVALFNFRGRRNL